MVSRDINGIIENGLKPIFNDVEKAGTWGKGANLLYLNALSLESVCLCAGGIRRFALGNTAFPTH